jgi:hypothetical protein
MTLPLVFFGAISLTLTCYALSFNSAVAKLVDSLFEEDTREARGVKLLREWLSAEHLASFDRRKSFVVIGCDSGKRYLVTYGVQQNVFEIDSEERALTGLCFMPEGYLVAGDVMLGQKISLETNELAALKVAKRFTPRFGVANNPVY